MYKIIRKTNISYSLIRSRTCAYQGVRNVSFSENFENVLTKWSLSVLIIMLLVSFCTPWKHQKNSVVFRGYKKRPVAGNGLIKTTFRKQSVNFKKISFLHNFSLQLSWICILVLSLMAIQCVFFWVLKSFADLPLIQITEFPLTSLKRSLWLCIFQVWVKIREYLMGSRHYHVFFKWLSLHQPILRALTCRSFLFPILLKPSLNIFII